jgi:serine/threonine protein kinase
VKNEDVEMSKFTTTLVISAVIAVFAMVTAADISPKQANGKAVDSSGDIGAFSGVVYEMLTGRIAFRGDAVTGTLAAVPENDPERFRLPVRAPMGVSVLPQRCSQKDPKQRLHDIGDAHLSRRSSLRDARLRPGTYFTIAHTDPYAEAGEPVEASVGKGVRESVVFLSISTLRSLRGCFINSGKFLLRE